MNNKKRWFKIIENVSFILAILISVYVLVYFFIARGWLPEGSCPVDMKKPWLFTAIGLALVSLVFSFIDSYTNKKNLNDEESDNEESAQDEDPQIETIKDEEPSDEENPEEK